MVSSTPARAEAVVLDRIVAVVNDDIVLESELARFMQTDPAVLTELQKLGGGATEESVARKLLELRPIALDALIALRLKLSEAPRFQLSATDNEIDTYIGNLARNNGMASVTDLRKAVEDSGQYGGWEDYRQTLKEQILSYKVESILAAYTVNDAQVRERYDKLSVSEDAKVEVLRFVFRPDSDEATDRDRSYADAKVVARRLNAAEDPVKIAAELGQSEEQRTIGKKDVPPAIEEALFAAHKGEVVGPLVAGQGFVVYKVIQTIDSGLVGFEQAKEQLRQQLEEEARVKAIDDLHEQLRARAHIDIRL